VFEDGLARQERSTAASRCARGRATPTGSPRSSDVASPDTSTSQVKEGADADSDPSAERADDSAGPASIRTTGKPRKFAYPPNLLASTAARLRLPRAGGVRRPRHRRRRPGPASEALEEVWLPNEAYPTILPRTSKALLLQRVAR